VGCEFECESGSVSLESEKSVHDAWAAIAVDIQKVMRTTSPKYSQVTGMESRPTVTRPCQEVQPTFERAAVERPRPRDYGLEADQSTRKTSLYPALAINEMEDVFKRVLKRLDKDGNGVVSLKEINQAIQDPSFKGKEAQLLCVLKKHYDDLRYASLPGFPDRGIGAGSLQKGISGDGMRRLHNLITQSEDGRDLKLVKDIELTIREAHNGVSGASRDLFADTRNPLSSIRPEAAMQGDLGNCYFVSALSALAASHPQAIRNMIKDNCDGTYTVRFPGAPGEPITVKAPTDAELGMYMRGSEHGTWPAVLEKAYGVYCNRHFWRRGPFSPLPRDVASEGSDGGAIRRSAGLGILTGASVDSDWLLVTREKTLHSKLTEAFAHGRPVVAGINRRLFPDEGLPDSHAYSVIGYHPETRTITLRNPWGGKNNGIFQMPLSEFKSKFSTIVYAQSR
jgi:hypothetical protein